jgi:hypothetical protein
MHLGLQPLAAQLLGLLQVHTVPSIQVAQIRLCNIAPYIQWAREFCIDQTHMLLPPLPPPPKVLIVCNGEIDPISCLTPVVKAPRARQVKTMEGGCEL